MEIIVLTKRVGLATCWLAIWISVSSFCFAQMPQPAAPVDSQKSEASPATLLEHARLLNSARRTYIGEERLFAQQALALTPQEVNLFRSRLTKVFEQGLQAVESPELHRQLATLQEIVVGESTSQFLYSYRKCLMGNLIEAYPSPSSAEFLVPLFNLKSEFPSKSNHLGLDTFEQYVRVLGRDGTNYLAHQTKADALLPATKKYFESLVLNVEGKVAGEILLRNPRPLLPISPLEKPADVHLTRQYGLLPIIVDREDREPSKTMTVFRFADGNTVAVPVPEIQPHANKEQQQQLWETIQKEITKHGDLAFWGSQAIIASGRGAYLGRGDLAMYASIVNRTKIPQWKNPGFDLFPYFENAYLLETPQGKRVLLTYSRLNPKEGSFCYAMLEGEQDRFQFGSPLSTYDFVLQERTPTLSEYRAREAYLSTRGRWLRAETDLLRESLEQLALGELKEAQSGQRAEAIRYLGELRLFDSIPLLIKTLDVDFPQTKESTQHPAVFALQSMVLAAREPMLKAILTAKGVQRQRLIAAWELIEGKEITTALLKENDIP